MGRSFITVLVVLMIGMLIGIVYLSSSRAEAVTPTPDARSILSATGEALGASCNAAGAYAFLKTRVSGSANLEPKLSGSGGSARGGIDPELACRLQRFLQAYPDLRIISGYRSAAYQDALCKRICGAPRCPGRCAPAGGSCHQYGLAVDVNKNSSAMRQAAKRFNLHYPYSKAHIQCIEHKTAGRSSCTSPCAKGGVPIDPGDYSPSSSNPNSSPYSNPNIPGLTPGGIPPGLGTPTGSVSSPGVGPGSQSTSVFNEAYNPELYGGDAGEEEGEIFFTGDGPPAFDELLGDFGEFGEGGEVREILGYDENATSSESTVPRFNNATSIRTSTSSATSTTTHECVDGVSTRNIYGNIICIKNSLATTTEVDFFGESTGTLIEAVSTPGSVTQTVTSLVDHILPIRHLVSEGITDRPGEKYVLDTGRVFSSYDVYTPSTSIAHGTNTRAPLQKEDIIAWMVQNDLIDADVTTQASMGVLLGIIRPILLHIVLTLFGTGSYAADAFLDLANNI